jgi:hypothetical protein
MSALQAKLAARPLIAPGNADRLLSSSQAARFLGVKISTLSQWRFHKRYELPFIRFGKGRRGGRCYYKLSDLERFVREHTYA